MIAEHTEAHDLQIGDSHLAGAVAGGSYLAKVFFVTLMLLGTVASVATLSSPALAQTVPLPTPAPSASSAPSKKVEQQQKLLPPPDVWSESEIADARRVCKSALGSMKAVFEELPPVKRGRCGAPAPIRLISIGGKHPVKFLPAPTINCGMLVPLKRWIDKGLQPLAARHLESPVASVSIMSSYSCRTRYGRKGARMSEHAFANALDIGGFRLADGKRISVLKDWGPTGRDIAAAKAAEVERAAKAAASASHAASQQTDQRKGRSARRQAAIGPAVALPEVRIKPNKNRSNRASIISKAVPLQNPSRSGTSFEAPSPSAQPRSIIADQLGERTATTEALPPLPTRRPLRQAIRQRVSLDRRDAGPNSRRDRPERVRAYKPPYRLGGPRSPASAPQAVFLRGIHGSACRIFGTTLGPEANEAHRNHFHFDMFPRRRSRYCE